MKNTGIHISISFAMSGLLYLLDVFGQNCRTAQAFDDHTAGRGSSEGEWLGRLVTS